MAENVKLTLEDSVMEKEESICPFCLKNSTKYTCPRCNTPYCSVDCYRSEKHKDCSETFYRDCFMQGLQEMNANPEEKQKMLDMLKQVEDDPDLNALDDPSDDLEERLGDLDLDKDTDKIWSRLTDQERKEFQQMAGDGRLGNIVELWVPWWVKSSPLVTEVEENCLNSFSDSASLVPKVASDIPHISKILKSMPSSEVKFNVINILFAYCYVCRLNNGEQVTMATEAAEDLQCISDVLGQGLSCSSVEEAIQMCLKNLTSGNTKFESSADFNISLLVDIEKIIVSSETAKPLHFLLAALSEITVIMKKSYKIISRKLKLSEKLDKEKNNKLKSKLFQINKKCEFYLSWAQTYGMALAGLVPDLQIVYSLLSAELEAVNQSKEKLEAEWKVKMKKKKTNTLIEEL